MSVVDLTCRLKRPTSMAEIVAAVKAVSGPGGPMDGIMGVTDEEVVSTDFRYLVGLTPATTQHNAWLNILDHLMRGAR